ncbi:MAG: type IV toxin-antitoxin system AbiEi family antitoxin domain-containing protein [Chloroflexi bacterium]|nr:type IV toxin-antitoxin system AbiEi family antitoxin domain-containing protein [Chloroflexota bacterium]
MRNPTQELIDLAHLRGVLRARDLDERGLPREYLSRLTARGVLVRESRGLYRLGQADISQHHTLALVGARIPGGVLCLLTALRFHGMTTFSPLEVWVAISGKAWRPVIRDLPVRVVRFSGQAFEAGHAPHTVEGVSLRVTTPAKTVADCFKFRNKLGLDVALEALREGWRAKRFTLDELWRFAQVDRVARVLRPYLESLE